MMRATFVGAAALASLVGASAGASAQVREQHGVFDVFCSADLYCTAETPMRTTDGLSGTFKIERGAAPGGKVFVSASPARDLVEGMRIDMDIYGTGLDRVTGVYGPVRKIYSGNEMTFAHNTTDDIVDWVRRGTVIDVTAAHEARTDVYRASLEGATAALLAFDRLQGRVVRRDAIVAYGPEPATESETYFPVPLQESSRDNTASAPERVAAAPQSVPLTAPQSVPPEAPAEASGPRQMVSGDIVYELGDVQALIPPEALGFGCQFGDTLQAYGGMLWEFSDGRYLLTVPCEPADVNLATIVVAGRIGQTGRLISFDTFGDITKLPVNASYDDTLKAISTTTYYGPDADCGEHFVYNFRGDGSTLAVRTRLEKASCDGRYGPPEDWPLTYSSAH